jgi:hypothetical protein
LNDGTIGEADEDWYFGLVGGDVVVLGSYVVTGGAGVGYGGG